MKVVRTFDPLGLPSPLWVLGTDTGVGKTYAASLIARVWAKAAPVIYRKPFQTGVPSEAHAEADAVALAGQGITAETGLVFRAPLSPLAAAEIDGIRIDSGLLDEMSAWCRRPVPDVAGLILEAAGGVMVPLAEGVLFADWASALRIPAIVVARGGLGTLNHVLLTCAALKSRGWDVAAVALNPGLDGSFEAAGGNADMLERFLDVPVCMVAGDRRPVVGG